VTLRHIAMFRFREGVREQDVADLEAALATLPEQIAELQAYSYGRDLGLSDDTFDYVVVADVADIQAYQRYQRHDAHQAVIAERVRPIVAERVALQYEL
jgi:hypothetical protein